MMVIEMRDNAYDTAFELLDEAKHSAKKTKLTLCELEDAMYDCYEATKEEREDYDDEYPDMEFRGRSGYRHDEHYGVREEDDDDRMDMRYKRAYRRGRGGLRMRRNRMGRFV